MAQAFKNTFVTDYVFDGTGDNLAAIQSSKCLSIKDFIRAQPILPHLGLFHLMALTENNVKFIIFE